MELDILRHSVSHILAASVKRLYPKALLAIGPSTKDGFYYDFDFLDVAVGQEDLDKIEKEMQNIIKQNLPFVRRVLPVKEAEQVVKNNTYKAQLLKDIPSGDDISFYKFGDFEDLCLGPHIKSTGEVKAFKLLSIAGAYWRGDSNNKMLTRIYGTAFATKKELDDYINLMEEAKKRDHRKIGTDFFTIMPEAPGKPFFLPSGMVVKNELEEFWRGIHTRRGYQELRTPIMLSQKLWEVSGHWGYYKENMYVTEIEKTLFAIKPMSCPGALLVYNKDMRSYKDLPIRYNELGLVHRHEASGTLHGLMRVRQFTQDDAHILCTLEQVESEVIAVVDMALAVYNTFGFECIIKIATRPEKSLGTAEDWEFATNSLKNALTKRGLKYEINEGEGVFYGPKIELHLKDCIGRLWQCGTVQFDFNLPKRFGCEYIGRDGKKYQPVMLHHVLFGSLDRFIGMLIEHTNAKMPTWLSPKQVCVIAVRDTHNKAAQKTYDELIKNNIRANLMTDDINFGAKIKDFRNSRTPYAVIIGDSEIEQDIITVKSRSGGEQKTYKLKDFIKIVRKEIDEKQYELSF